jgi:two-component system, NarL family, invasion response regulator UvrY
MKVLIADDHPVVREGLKEIVKKEISVTLFDAAANGAEALDKLEKSEYDLIILDVSMPDISGLDVLQIIKNKGVNSHILMLSVHAQDQYAIRALKLGASGYLCKSDIYEELATAIKTIVNGGRYISQSLADKIIFDKSNGFNIAPHEKLSKREFQIMCMLGSGKSVKEIAGELFISDKTVSTHRMRILGKMGMKKNAELISYAIRNELL